MKVINRNMYIFHEYKLILSMYLYLGSSSAVPVGTAIAFGCDDYWVFSHDWYQKPVIKITCQADGLFDEPENWPNCVDRKIFHV